MSECEWINVEDDLPKNSDRMLAYCSGNIFFAHYNHSMKAWKRDTNDLQINQIVTHWVPLPEPPK